jgi:hypothetical protein
MRLVAAPANVTLLRKPPITDDGAAAIVVRLRDGNITVHHADDPDMLLAEKRNAPPGTWDALWESMRALGIKPVGL